MKLIKEIRENVAILTLRGDFDSFVCNPFIEQVNDIFDKGINHLVVDLRLVLFINSTGIGALIKAHKETKKREGGMVLCRPSKFVTGVLETLGLTNLFQIAEDPEKAVADLGASQDGMDVGGDNKVIIRLPGKGKETCIGKILSIEEKGMAISISEAKDEVAVGTEIGVKFRVPLFMKSYYFDALAEVTDTVHSTSDFRIKCTFKSMAEEDLKSISQFVEEMKFLKGEAKKNS